MIDYLYFGEANIFHENEDFQLNGLMGSGDEEEMINKDFNYTTRKVTQKQAKLKNITTQETKTPNGYFENFEVKVEASPPLEGNAAVTDTVTVAADLQDLDEKINTMMEDAERKVFSGNQNRKTYLCKVCGREGDVTGIRMHIESKHITGISQTCHLWKS